MFKTSKKQNRRLSKKYARQLAYQACDVETIEKLNEAQPVDNLVWLQEIDPGLTKILKKGGKK